MPFQKGKSGNPGGRPKVVGEVQALAREYTTEAIETIARHHAGQEGAPRGAGICGQFNFGSRLWPALTDNQSTGRDRPPDQMTDAELLAIAAQPDDDDGDTVTTAH